MAIDLVGDRPITIEEMQVIISIIKKPKIQKIKTINQEKEDVTGT